MDTVSPWQEISSLSPSTGTTRRARRLGLPLRADRARLSGEEDFRDEARDEENFVERPTMDLTNRISRAHIAKREIRVGAKLTF